MNDRFPPARSCWPAVLLAGLLLLLQALLLYGHTGRDDAFLTYWPAYTLSEYGQILNYNGERVEQSSTLLLTLLLALAQTLLPMLTLPTLAWGLSLLAGVLTLAGLARCLPAGASARLALLVLACAPSLVFWSSSGMETLLTASLLTWLLALCLAPQPAPAGLIVLVTALAVLGRPETFLVLACFAVLGWGLDSLLLRPAGPRRPWLSVLATALLGYGLLALWRQAYFGDLFPQPVSAKSAGLALANLWKGFFYLLHGGGSWTTQALTGLGLLAWLLALCQPRHPQRRGILLAGALALGQIAFVLASGGDWMDATRFLLPVLPALLLCLVLYLAPWQRLQGVALALLLALALADGWHFVRTESVGLPLHERNTLIERYLPEAAQRSPYSATELQTKDALRDIPQLEHLRSLLQRLQTHPAPLQLASIQMGFIPYHLDRAFYPRLRFLDLRALSTRELTRCYPLRDFARTDTGLRISYDEFFGLLPVLQRQCGVSRPDVIYDMGYAMRAGVLRDNGYVITYRENRSIRGDFARRAIGSELFVAVRRELAAQYGLRDADGQPVSAAAAPPPAPKPNIVLVIADDISYDHFGFMGSRAARTPTLDQLAQQGTVFTTAYAPVAFCRPSLATLLTGQWPHQTRLHANRSVISLPPGSITLATRLQQHGYYTFSGGKFWEDEPEQRGFDRFDTNWNRFGRENQDELWAFIDAHAGRDPMFIWWAPMLPHVPHNPPPALLQAIDPAAIAVPAWLPEAQHAEFRDKERQLLAMNLWFDQELDKLRQRLAASGQLDNTLFIFLADNGFSHRSESKSTPYELGIRTPLLFSWPGHVPAQRIEAETATLHLFSTILDFAGLPAPATAPLSHSLKPVITGQARAVPEDLYGASYAAHPVTRETEPRPERDLVALHVRSGSWKYILYLRDLREADNASLTIKSGMKPFPTRQAGDEELYDLVADPYEDRNLAGDQARQAQVIALRQQVLAWWKNTGGKPFDAARGCPQQPAALCSKLLITTQAVN